MSHQKAGRFIVAVDGHWCSSGGKNRKLLDKQSFPLGAHSENLSPAAELTLRFRDGTGKLRIDTSANIHVHEDQVMLHSGAWSSALSAERCLDDTVIIVFVEHVQGVARMWIHCDRTGIFQSLNAKYPELRLEAFELPPVTSTLVDSEDLITTIVRTVTISDRELTAPHTDNFLRAPPILVPLATHVAGLSADENLRFPLQLKKLSDHFRQLLQEQSSSLKIEKIERNHLDAWAEAQGKRYAFLDGGVARVLGLPGGEPTAMRVGIYCSRAGDVSMLSREQWSLVPFVLGDILDRETSPPIPEDRSTDVRRLAEAARYTLEALAAVRYADRTADLQMLFVHGPLINQFAMYDEGEPNFIPYLRTDFLEQWGISESDLLRLIPEIPQEFGGKRMWRQFMAVYGYLALALYNHARPIVGVVERSAGRWLAEAVLDGAVRGKVIKESYKKKAIELLRKYGISDDFLFGCVLDEGEYITPKKIFKNNPRRARDRWQEVVGRYPHPEATVLKTSSMSFPFRVEMNAAAFACRTEVMKMIYHTARLLPRYAFPVGLDIVDRYAKVPDWLSKGVSARLGAVVLERAMAQGDARVIAQLRQFLAHTPRDFFYRPQS